MIYLVAAGVAFAVAIAILALAINVLTGSHIMGKLDDIIAEEKAALDMIKAARAADAAKTDALSAQIADLKSQLTNVATPDQLAALQSVADELKAVGGDTVAVAPTEPAPAPAS